MADLIFNCSLGRIHELAKRVNGNDPTNSAFIVTLLAATGIEADSVLRDKDDLAALVSGTTNEATNTLTSGTMRKTITTVTIDQDDTNDWVDVDIADQTWNGLANDGTGAVSDLVTLYDSDTTAGTDANIEPMTLHDFAVTPDGSDVTAQFDVEGFFRAQQAA